MATDTSVNWLIVPAGGTNRTSVVPEDAAHNYDLVNMKVAERLAYGERRWGINLVWDDPGGEGNMRFQRPSGTKEPLKNDEAVAIHVRGGGFLKYESRTFGINLGWSQTPVFEWQIRGASGDVKIPQPVQLFNTRENDYMIYGERPLGINLRWVNSAPASWGDAFDLFRKLFHR
jgi:hypothetical protein